MTNERWLRWAIARHFRQKGFNVNMRPVKVGNAVIYGEVVGGDWRMALEVISTNDDVVRGIGQLAEALSHGYCSAALETSVRRARQLDSSIFKNGIVLLGIDSRAQVVQVFP